MKKTKIICTMGPNTDNRELLYGLAKNGMDIARLNFSHGDHEEQLGRINNIRSVRKELNLPIAMLLDTQGPEIRTGLLKDDKKVTLIDGQKFILTTETILGDSERVSITYPNLPQDVKVGNSILIDDGLIELKVEKLTEKDIICTVLSGGELSQKKGINVPNVSVKLPAITEKDKKDILFGIEQGVDFIAASFIRNADAVREIKTLLKENNADISIIAKIENQEGVRNIDEIIAEADGIMVARGDLGVEIPAEEVPFIQKRLIKKCNDAYKPVITATQMLDSMIRNARPTRAEVTDVANAIYDGTDAIMLSGETAMGKYPIEAVKMMSQIAEATEIHLDYEQILKKKKMYRHRGTSSAVCYSSVATAANVNAKLIVASSMSGFTARMVSKFKPDAQIIGLSPKEETLRKMQIYWGVKPILTKEVHTTDELLDTAIETVTEQGYAKVGDVVVLTGGGASSDKHGVTNMMKVVTIDEE